LQSHSYPTETMATTIADKKLKGVLFSSPARRPFHFRHQTNSFSFDESERSSAAYEQDRVSSTSTTNSRPRPTSDISLHDELRGRDVRGSISDVSTSTPASVALEYKSTRFTAKFRDLTPLQLPPPFSTASRSSSRTESLPSHQAADYTLVNKYFLQGQTNAVLSLTARLILFLIRRWQTHKLAQFYLPAALRKQCQEYRKSLLKVDSYDVLHGPPAGYLCTGHDRQ